MNPGGWLLLISLLLWCLAVLGAARRTAQALATGGALRGHRWTSRWGAAIRQSRWQAVNLRAIRRLYVALSCGATLPAALTLVIAVEANDELRRALLLRLAAMQRRAVGGGLSGRASGSARLPGLPALTVLRHLDLLVDGVLSRQQLLADWRIELLCSRLASGRDYHARCADQETTEATTGRLATGIAAGSAADPDRWLQRSTGTAHRRYAGAASH